jgi:hypothetical protein
MYRSFVTDGFVDNHGGAKLGIVLKTADRLGISVLLLQICPNFIGG